MRVIIVEDEKEMCDHLASVVNDINGAQLIGVAQDLNMATKLVKSDYDLMLVDLHLKSETSFDLIRQESANEDRKILVISLFGDATNTIAAIQAGASGYVLKTDTHVSIKQSILAIIEGRSPISPAIAGHLLREFRGSVQTSQEIDFNLSPRERQVLKSLALGKSYKETASDLNISYNTVNAYTKTLYKKLNASSRTEAINTAMPKGTLADYDAL